MKEIADLITEKRFFDLYILARYFYRMGEPILSDAVFDNLQKDIEKVYGGLASAREYLERSYDDDPIPEELLAEFGFKPIYVVKSENRMELYNYLNEDKSLSIRSVTEFEEAFEFFKMLRQEKLDFVASVKIDGVNTKMLYLDSKFALSLSRGRNGDSFDYTDNSAKIMPERFEGAPEVLKLVGESFVADEGLNILRKKYNKPDGYVSGKSSAISMLRVEHKREDYRFLKTKAFYAEGLADTLAGTLTKLKEAGIDTVPWKLFSWKDIPDTITEFKEWCNEKILNRLEEATKDIPSDGVVVEVNNLGWLGTQHNQYVNRQLALKFGHWGFQCYEGIVKRLIIEQKRVNKSVRIEIEPVRTRDGNKATIINSFNPSIVLANDLYEGKHIFFERNSDAANVLIYGERLKEIKQNE